MDLEHGQAGVLFRQRDVDSFLESSKNTRVERPGSIRRAENQDALRILAHTVHLHKELGLDTSAAFALRVRSGRTQRVYLIDEDDARVMASAEFEEISHQAF